MNEILGEYETNRSHQEEGYNFQDEEDNLNDYYKPEVCDDDDANAPKLHRSLQQISSGATVKAAKRAFGHLAEIVRENSLLYLPSKSLLRSRSVSKNWNQWISSPFFIHMHSQFDHELSGIFFHHSIDENPVYSSFDLFCHGLPNPPLSFLPEPVMVLASTNGLVCCWGRLTFLFFICNPITKEWTPLPRSTNTHRSEPPVSVIVFDEPFEYNGSADYQLVFACELGEGQNGRYIYGFEVFSSKDWVWKSSAHICTIERIVPESGVAVSGSVYWRTEKPTVLKYCLVSDTWRSIRWPAEYCERDRWELGQIGCQLYCTLVYQNRGVAFVLENETRGEWRVAYRLKGLRMRYGVVGEEDEWPMPLRAQGGGMIPFLGGRMAYTRSLQGKRDRVVEGNVPEVWSTVVPYVSSLLPVKRGDHDGCSYRKRNSEELGDPSQSR